MEATKSMEEVRSMVINSSKNIEPLTTKTHSQMACRQFGDFFRCLTSQSCPNYQDCLRAWMKRIQDSPIV